MVFLMLAAFLLSANSASASTISGHVYLEEGDGSARDAEEVWGIGDIEMKLTGGNSPLITTTDMYGYYEFTADAGSDYTITQVGLHSEYFLVYPSTSGGSGTTVDAPPAPEPIIEKIDLNADVSGYNFGNIWWNLFFSGGQAISGVGIPPYATEDPNHPNILPEPGSLLMLLSGSAFVAFALRRRRRK
jgi:hypothetical protein